MSEPRTAISTRNNGGACKRWALIALSCAILGSVTACSNIGTKAMPELVAMPPPPPPPSIPTNLRQPCPTLPAARSDIAIDLLDNHDQVTEQYHNCADGKARLLQAVDEFQRTAEAWYCQALQRLAIANAACTQIPTSPQRK